MDRGVSLPAAGFVETADPRSAGKSWIITAFRRKYTKAESPKKGGKDWSACRQGFQRESIIQKAATPDGDAACEGQSARGTLPSRQSLHPRLAHD